MRVTCLVLSAARADKLFELSWFVVLIPVLVGSAWRILAACRIKWRYRAEQKRKAAQANPAAEEDEEEPGEGVVESCGVVGCWLFMAIGAAVKFNGSGYSAFLVILPLMLFVVCCMCCYPSLIILIQERPPTENPDGGADPEMGAEVIGAGTSEEEQAERAQLFEAIFQSVLEANAAASAAELAAAADAGGGDGGDPTAVASPITDDAGGGSGAVTSASPTAEANSSELRPGLVVTIHGLKGAAELNGQEATCEEWIVAQGRWMVRLKNDDVKAVKATNLKAKEDPTGDVLIEEATGERLVDI